MSKFAIMALVSFASLSPALAQLGDASRGQQDFRACAPCHSLEPDRNMTGPSVASLWGRKAGSLPSFDRYSDALKSSGIIWDDRALDGWLTDPERMVPDNDMPFEGINKDPAQSGQRSIGSRKFHSRAGLTFFRQWHDASQGTCVSVDRQERRGHNSSASLNWISES
jgi:cytochrome c2